MRVILILLLTLVYTFSLGQTEQKSRYYKVKVKTYNSDKLHYGILYSVSDSSISIIPTSKNYKEVEAGTVTELLVLDIESVKKSTLKAGKIGFIVGAIGGALFGGVVGVLTGANGAIVTSAAAGAMIIGSAISAIASMFGSKQYRIKGNLDTYHTKHMMNLNNKSLFKRR